MFVSVFVFVPMGLTDPGVHCPKYDLARSHMILRNFAKGISQKFLGISQKAVLFIFFSPIIFFPHVP